MSVTHLTEKVDDNRLISPVDLLRRTADEIESGEINASRVIVGCLDDTDDNYDVFYRASNISASQSLSVLEIMKKIMVDTMGY